MDKSEIAARAQTEMVEVGEAGTTSKDHKTNTSKRSKGKANEAKVQNVGATNAEEHTMPETALKEKKVGTEAKASEVKAVLEEKQISEERKGLADTKGEQPKEEKANSKAIAIPAANTDIRGDTALQEMEELTGKSECWTPTNPWNGARSGCP